MSTFMFATGIENSYPTIALPDGRIKRVDELEKANHYQRWKEDFQLVRESGIRFLRYGPPLYKTHVAPGVYDWSFTDLVFNEMKRLGITPIVDLCHFGVPDWIGSFQNPDFPVHFAEYARLSPAVPVPAPLHAGQRDFHRGHVFGPVRLVE
jgi:beta-glucosidase/6-phospho-beta-glucosidase/beta-galactosidase